MAIHWRPMQPKDVRECSEIVAAHPVIGPRYGSALSKLCPAWSSLLGSDAAIMVVFEEIKGSRKVVCGAGVAVFVGAGVCAVGVRPPAVGPLQLRDDGAAEADRPRAGRDPDRADQVDEPPSRRSGGGPGVLVHHDGVDDVELPGRGAADRRLDRAV